MAKKSHRKKLRSKSKTMRYAQRGGELAGNPPSAWGWGLGTAGNGWTQFLNAATLQPGQNLATQQGLQLVPVNNINANNSQGMIGANLKGDIPGSQSGGKKRRNRRRGSRRGSRRGGSWGAVASQAAVPGALVALNQYFGKSRRRR